MIVRIVIVLIFAAAIFGTAGYFYYNLFLLPEKQLEQEVASLPAVPTPTPDRSLPEYEKILEIDPVKDRVAARNAYLQFVQNFPESSRIAEAKERLGELNADMTLSTFPDESKTNYTVVSGDSLIRIASKTGTNAELIYRSNNLDTINLQIGQEFLIPQLEPALVVDGDAGTVTLYDGTRFFKEYPIVSYSLPGGRKPSPGTTRVTDKLALVDGSRVAFGSEGFADSERWLMLDIPGLAIRGAPEESEDGEPVSMPPGIILSPGDAEELFVLVSQGTPVTIK